MDNKLQARVDLFVDNTRAIKGYTFSERLVKQMAALLYTVEGRPLDTEHLRTCYNMIAKSTGMFSAFRSHLHLALAAMLALSGNPETQLENAIEVYKLLVKAGFHRTDPTAVAAFEIAAKADSRNYESVVGRAQQFYKGMKRNHVFITGEDDYVYAAMLALTDLDVAEGVDHVEALYAALKPHLRNANSIQALSQVMAVSNAPGDTAARVLALREATKAAGIRMDKQYTLSSLGILALLPGQTEEIAEDIKDAYNYIRGQRGFGLLGNSQQSLLLLAGALVAAERTQQTQNDLVSGNLSTTFNNILIAEYTAVIAAIIAMSAASSASSSSSGS